MHDLMHDETPPLAWAQRLADVLALDIAGRLATWLCFGKTLLDAPPVHMVLLYFCCCLAFLLLPHGPGLCAGRALAAAALRLATAWAGVLLSGLLFSMLIGPVGTPSHLWLAYWFGAGLLTLAAARSLTYAALYYLRTLGLNSRRVLLLGYGPTGREMHRRTQQQPWLGYQVLAIQDDQADQADPAGLSAGAPAPLRLAPQADLGLFVTANAVQEIWVALPLGAAARLHELQRALRHVPVALRWMPDPSGGPQAALRMVDFLGMPAFDLNRLATRGAALLVKAVFDRVFALAALVALAPLFCVIAACIKCSSPGPVFFRQRRNGLDGKAFDVYKFRSMQVHQEHGTLTQARRGDVRLIRIGHFIRRTSLDELPQFINVLLGDMSVVGPRPHAVQHNELYRTLLESYQLRQRVKPGITGWAQMHGHRGGTDTLDKMALRVKYDLDYIQHWSLWLDLRIIAWTAVRGWHDKNAY